MDRHRPLESSLSGGKTRTFRTTPKCAVPDGAGEGRQAGGTQGPIPNSRSGAPADTAPGDQGHVPPEALARAVASPLLALWARRALGYVTCG